MDDEELMPVEAPPCAAFLIVAGLAAWVLLNASVVMAILAVAGAFR